LVISPKLVAEASDTPGFAQLARLKRLKTSNRNWREARYYSAPNAIIGFGVRNRARRCHLPEALEYEAAPGRFHQVVTSDAGMGKTLHRLARVATARDWFSLNGGLKAVESYKAIIPDAKLPLDRSSPRAALE
jgi:hypothetical protein